MSKRKDDHPGHGKLLDAWVPPPGAGDPVGCVATSFTFEPAFFEEQCLSRFLRLDSDPADDGAAYLVEREEKLSQVACAAAMVDRHHCRGKRSLRWDLLPARIPGGLLHAKVALLHWAGRVRLLVASANLTDSGYRVNREVFGVLDYHPESEAPLACLRETVDFLREAIMYCSQAGTAARGRWLALLDRVRRTPDDWGDAAEPWGGRHTRVFPVLVAPGRDTAFDQVRSHWPPGSPPDHAEVTSPFFDPPGSPLDGHPADALWTLLRQRGEAEVVYVVTGEDVPDEDATFLHAPRTLLDAQPPGRPQASTAFQRLEVEDARPLHAKTLWLENDRWSGTMIGSSNFTRPGTGLAATPNVEANLLYLADEQRNPKGCEALEHAALNGKAVALDRIRWQARPDDGEDAESGEILLPEAFGEAVFAVDANEQAFVRLAFAGSPPAGWSVLSERHGKPFLDDAQWSRDGRPAEIELRWADARPPSGFLVTWPGAGGEAWWPVNVERQQDLPPPAELRNLPLEVLIDILTSARPLHRALAAWLKRREIVPRPGVDPSLLDPHRRVDTSAFLLQRTRRISWALSGLRARLERPVATEDALAWRLRGPVGVRALADAVLREAHRDEERQFLLAELALELSWVRPRAAPGCLTAGRVREAIAEVVGELHDSVAGHGEAGPDALRRYIGAAFEEARR